MIAITMGTKYHHQLARILTFYSFTFPNLCSKAWRKKKFLNQKTDSSRCSVVPKVSGSVARIKRPCHRQTIPIFLGENETGNARPTSSKPETPSLRHCPCYEASEQIRVIYHNSCLNRSSHAYANLRHVGVSALKSILDAVTKHRWRAQAHRQASSPREMFPVVSTDHRSWGHRLWGWVGEDNAVA